MNFPEENPFMTGGHRLGTADLFRLSLRVFRTKPMRTFLTILGMSVGIGTVLFLISFGYGLQYILIGKLVSTEDSLITMEAYFPSESQRNITSDDLKKIIDIPEVNEVSPVAEFTGEMDHASSTGLTLVRIVRPNFFRLSGTVPDIGRQYTESDAGLVASSQAIRLMGLLSSEGALNRQVGLMVDYQSENDADIERVKSKEPLTLRGIITDDLQAPYVVVPADFIEKQPPFFKKVLVKAKNIDLVENLRDRLIADGYLISARIDLVNQAKKVMSIVTITLGVFGIAALIVSAIGMFNTMIIGFMERIYEVGVMKSIGGTDRDIKNLFLMESVMMGISGGIGGIIFGVGLGQAANLGLNLIASHFGGKPFTLFITPVWFILLIIGVSAFIGFVSGFWPAQRASYLSPKEAFIRK
ncbi:ABC transporter permease [Candidatus Wolfebacteria bacterium]|nr:ABC transporter permease [Candidatus Wolfebacteria bacterium]